MTEAMEFTDDPVVAVYEGKKGMSSMKYWMALQFDSPILSLIGIHDLGGPAVGHRSFLGKGCEHAKRRLRLPAHRPT
jgi:hypothetical protein